jgi:hypothetical protein
LFLNADDNPFVSNYKIGMAVLQTGCASAPPTAFETAESLEGTAWVQGSILAMNDKTSGVFTDREDKETAQKNRYRI